ncbi:hypothetical protein GSY74_08080 [Sulfurovum sp. bin170]|uniref:hypothetical protein n=1 Tax=Sulfurovum sp. bin170 TaxID=2695268 RepID=UPI0013E0C12F|nr:hypothetical protein [Sulfurovum sp. bin170]NEW61239.1 hypothetical protein [Sulfurovum sp. bin170]
MKKITSSTILALALATTTIEAGSWYIGTNIGLINFGGEVEVENDYTTYKSTKDVDSSPFMLKFGYQKNNDNRTEFYLKKDNIEIVGELFKTSTIGFNYEWGLSSMSKESILPYISLGIGVGNSSSKYLAYDDGTVIELALSGGVHYRINKNIDTTVGLFRRALVNSVSDVATYSYYGYESTDYLTTAVTNGIEVGISYHF